MFKPGSYASGPSDNASHESGSSPSGRYHHSGAGGPSGSLNAFSHPNHGGIGFSGNFDVQPSSFEELSALTSDIVCSLKNVRHLPRYEAFTAVMNSAFKYLYWDG